MEFSVQPAEEPAFRVTRNGGGGYTYAATRHRRFDRPMRGVVMPATDRDDLVRTAFALSLRLPEATWFSHTTAARLLSLPVPLAERHALVHVSARPGTRVPRTDVIASHHREWPLEPSGGLQVHSGTGEPLPLRVEKPTVTLFSSASILNLADCVALGDAVLLRHDPTTVRAEWELLLEHTERRRGGRRFRQTISLVREGVRSRAETHLRLLLGWVGLPEPTVGHPVSGDGWTQHPDLAWPQWRVAVEYEGDGHRTSEWQFASDLRRFERYADEGWHALRATRLDLYRDPSEFLARLVNRLRRAGWRPPRRWALRAAPRFVA